MKKKYDNTLYGTQRDTAIGKYSVIISAPVLHLVCVCVTPTLFLERFIRSPIYICILKLIRRHSNK